MEKAYQKPVRKNANCEEKRLTDSTQVVVFDPENWQGCIAMAERAKVPVGSARSEVFEMKLLSTIVISSVLVLTGCQSTGPRESAGGLIGAAAGGLIGAQFGGGSGRIAAAVVGAVAGSALGSEIGRQMDADDRRRQAAATARALETHRTGETLPWQSDHSDNYGSVTPERTWQRADGTYCREFTQRVTIGGKEETAYGTACRQPDGAWKIMS